MGKVMTVLGEIDSKDMGFTSMHDHIMVDLRFYNEMYKTIITGADPTKMECKCENLSYLNKGYFGLSPDCMYLNDVDLASEELTHFKNAGGATMLEVSPIGIRGNIQDTKKISENTGINIIASAGYYGEGFWPEYSHMSVEELQAQIEKEIYEGIDGTDIKAGHIKIACNYFSELEEKALRAGGKAASKTGLSIQVHTGIGMSLEEHTMKMIKILTEEEGVDPKKIIMCHIDQFVVTSLDIADYVLNHAAATEPQLENIKKILDTGIAIGYDTVGNTWSLDVIGKYQPNDYDRVRGLLPLIQAGYSKQIVLGTDLYTKQSYRKYGGNGYTGVLEKLIPLLKMFEVSDEDIQNMTVNNPVRLLEY